MYVLKKNGKVFRSKFFGTGSSSYEKIIYRAAVSQRLGNSGLWQYLRSVSLNVSATSLSAEELLNLHICFKNETVPVTIFAMISGLM